MSVVARSTGTSFEYVERPRTILARPSAFREGAPALSDDECRGVLTHALPLGFEPDECRPPAPAACRRASEAFHLRKPLQKPLNVGALHSFASAVNETHLSEAPLLRFSQVFLDDREHVAGLKAMQVERVLYLQDCDRFSILVGHGSCTYKRQRSTSSTLPAAMEQW